VIQVNATFDVQTLSLQVKCLESEVAWWRFWNSEEGFFAIKKHPLILADYADPVFGLECISPCNLCVLSVTVVVGITNQTRSQSHNDHRGGRASTHDPWLRLAERWIGEICGYPTAEAYL